MRDIDTRKEFFQEKDIFLNCVLCLFKSFLSQLSQL